LSGVPGQQGADRLPLDGVRVVDFTEYIAGPYCTMMLADMGADVIKVERPQGDAWRHTASVAPYESRAFLGVNRGKRSIALDLEQDEAREVARRLCKRSDVIVQNYRPGVAERLGLDHKSLKAANPGLIYCQNSAFGDSGPYKDRPGFDLLSQAATGMILYEQKLDKGLPSPIATLAVADVSSGMFMAYSIACALLQRATTGQGQLIETSLFASGLAVQYRPLTSVESIDAPVRAGFLGELAARRVEGISAAEALTLRSEYIAARGRNHYYRIYEARDGLIAVACLNNRQRRAMRDVVGVDDPTIDGLAYDWFSEEVRKVHHETREGLEAAFREQSVDQWLSRLDAADVPCARVVFPEEIFDDPHVAANQLIREMEHAVLGTLKMPAPPMVLDGARPEAQRPPPALGEHSAEVLEELGYEQADIDRLRQLLAVLDPEGLTDPGDAAARPGSN
jgi:crotonobetainyl-CoA:carnitine CoA-transferase CaiB-like acyl-CoA transferase